MTLLVLGWKPRFEETLRTLGMPVVIVLGEEERVRYEQVARDVGEVLNLPDKADVGRLLPALTRSGHGRGDITHVYTDQETPMVPGALLAEHLGARALSVSSAVLVRDKFLQKKALRMAGIDVAEHRLVPVGAAARAAVLGDFRYPAVIKPISAWGSRHIAVVGSADEAAAVLAALPPGLPDADAFVVEEFVDGPEMHADGQLVDGEVAFLSVSRYWQPVLSTRRTALVGSRIVDPEDGAYPQAELLVRSVAKAFELETTTFHLEYFETSRGLVFSELAARTGGTWVTDTVREKFGVDLRQLALRSFVGLGAGRVPPTGDGVVGWSYLPAPAGTIRALPAEPEILALPGVRRVELDQDLLGSASDRPRRAGLVLLAGDDDADLRRRLDHVIEWFGHSVVMSGGEVAEPDPGTYSGKTGLCLTKNE